MILQRNFGWNCLSLEDAKSSGHTKTSPSFIQDNNNVKSNEGVEVKLPKLELMKFSWTITINGRVSGTCLNLWLTETLTFQESKKFTYIVFEELWDRRSRICNNIILLGCLSLKMILETVINILRDRFGKAQLLISYHMVALLKLAIVSSVHGTKKLRDLYDNSEINIQSLKALGIESESFGNLLVPVDNSSYVMALK